MESWNGMLIRKWNPSSSPFISSSPPLAPTPKRVIIPDLFSSDLCAELRHLVNISAVPAHIECLTAATLLQLFPSPLSHPFLIARGSSRSPIVLFMTHNA